MLPHPARYELLIAGCSESSALKRRVNESGLGLVDGHLTIDHVYLDAAVLEQILSTKQDHLRYSFLSPRDGSLFLRVATVCSDMDAD